MGILYAVLLLLGLTSYVHTETCPAEHEIKPCYCDEYGNEDSDYILVICDDDVRNLTGLKEALNGLSNKTNVDLTLRRIKLRTVPSNFFYGLEITKLYFTGSQLDSLGDDDQPNLLGLEDSLEVLRIRSGFTEESVPAKLNVGHLRKLLALELHDNVITELGDDWFDRGPASLEYLLISNNGIVKVGSKAFANLINLKELFFHDNRFGPIKRSMFPSPAESLNTIELDNNALTRLPEDIFSNMPALKRISLGKNGILRLEQSTWHPVWQQLVVIYLDGNPIECDSHMNWMFSLNRTNYISGECNAPQEKKGESLEDFIDSGISTGNQ